MGVISLKVRKPVAETIQRMVRGTGERSGLRARAGTAQSDAAQEREVNRRTKRESERSKSMTPADMTQAEDREDPASVIAFYSGNMHRLDQPN
jgi:hypothetical protein